MKRLLVLATGALVVGAFSLAQAQHDHDRGSMGTGHGEQMDAEHGHMMSQLHGGISTMTKAHHFEAVYLADGIRVYIYDGSQKPTTAEDVSGEVTITYANKDMKALDVPLEYVPAEEMKMGNMKMTASDYLFASVDLSKAVKGSFGAKFEISGLPTKAESKSQFDNTFTGLTATPYMCPMHADAWGETADSKCPLCGMKTTATRSDMMGVKKTGNIDHDQ